MKLIAGIPDPKEYRVDLKVTPRVLKPGGLAKMTFRIREPESGKPVEKFEVLHEKLFHLFLIGQDLRFFAHEHPEPQPDGSFTFAGNLPESGQYRLLCDFYPAGGTPQMIAKTIIVGGTAPKRPLLEDLEPQSAENVRVSLRMEPAKPIAGTKTMLFFELDQAEGLQPYLGAWGHLLAASADLIDMIHAHPAWEEGGPKIQFNVIFPRPGMHRVWAQFQRNGVVNTVAFNVPVMEL
jgi:hypothetical protein